MKDPLVEKVMQHVSSLSKTEDEILSDDEALRRGTEAALLSNRRKRTYKNSGVFDDYDDLEKSQERTENINRREKKKALDIFLKK